MPHVWASEEMFMESVLYFSNFMLVLGMELSSLSLCKAAPLSAKPSHWPKTITLEP